MRKIIVLLVCLTLVFQANARLVLTGVVTDKQDTKPVEGATVELLRLPDSTAVESIKTRPIRSARTACASGISSTKSSAYLFREKLRA